MGEIHKRENPLNTMKNISILDIKSVQKFQKLDYPRPKDKFLQKAREEIRTILSNYLLEN